MSNLLAPPSSNEAPLTPAALLSPSGFTTMSKEVLPAEVSGAGANALACGHAEVG